KTSPTPPNSPQGYYPSSVARKPAEIHAKHLEDFLDSHLKCIASLRDALRSPTATPDGQASVMSSPLPNGCGPAGHGRDKAFEALGSQFNMLVVISTFTASLIIAFLSLVKSIVIDNHQIAFDVGMLLSFFAMSIHFGNIIVAGRGSALTSQHTADDDAEHTLAYFHHYLQLCEQLQFFATVIDVPPSPARHCGSGQLGCVLERLLEGVYDISKLDVRHQEGSRFASKSEVNVILQ
ncbi:hypothetical protein H0H87_006971, partial [Tephrocybe sp. NHM501043]